MFTFISIAASWIYFCHFIWWFLFTMFIFCFLLPSPTYSVLEDVFSLSLRGHAYILNMPHNLRKTEVISSSVLSSPILSSLLVHPVFFLNLPKLAFIIRVADYPIHSTSLSLWNSEKDTGRESGIRGCRYKYNIRFLSCSVEWRQ